jgi:uncharacterized protein (UPF0128 family)
MELDIRIRTNNNVASTQVLLSRKSVVFERLQVVVSYHQMQMKDHRLWGFEPLPLGLAKSKR